MRDPEPDESSAHTAALTPHRPMGQIERYGHTSPVALALTAETPFEAWTEIGRTLGVMGRSVRWWIGDWLTFGETRYGERYAQAMEATGFDYQSLQNMTYVSTHVAPAVRREDLTWSHHSEVAAVEGIGEQAAWLARAVSEKWTQKQLRKAVAAASGVESPGAGSVEPPSLGALVRQSVLSVLLAWQESGERERDHALGGGAYTQETFARLAQRVAGLVEAEYHTGLTPGKDRS